MIRVNHQLYLDEKDLDWQFVRASGPGGQNVNKVATAVQLRFNLRTADYLPERLRQRLGVIARKRITKDGYLLIDAYRYRTQERNREDALERLIELIRRASIIPKLRIPTKPTLASKQRRLQSKRLTSSKKHLRRGPSREE
jgi:ribosome-associated protein